MIYICDLKTALSAERADRLLIIDECNVVGYLFFQPGNGPDDIFIVRIIDDLNFFKLYFQKNLTIRSQIHKRNQSAALKMTQAIRGSSLLLGVFLFIPP